MIYAENLKATIGGVEYTWSGGYGAVLKSYEKVKDNEVRIIGNEIFYAKVDRMISAWPWSPRWIYWIPQKEIDHKFLAEFKAAIFR